MRTKSFFSALNKKVFIMFYGVLTRRFRKKRGQRNRFSFQLVKILHE